MFYIVKIYICVKNFFYIMGKKKVAQVMQPAESGSFLAGQVQPTAEVGEVGIQEIQINEGELQNITAIEYEYCYYAPYGITKCAVEDCDRYPTFKIVNQYGIKFYVCKPHAKEIIKHIQI
jgi:hypothetical protein